MDDAEKKPVTAPALVCVALIVAVFAISMAALYRQEEQNRIMRHDREIIGTLVERVEGLKLGLTQAENASERCEKRLDKAMDMTSGRQSASVTEEVE